MDILIPIGVILFSFFGVVASNRYQARHLKRGMVQLRTQAGRVFWVVDDPRRIDAAVRMLDEVAQSMEKIMGHVEEGHEGVDALVAMYHAMDNRFELIENKRTSDTDPVALNYAKGAAIALCLFDSSGRPASSSALLSVALHEMAHTMDDGRGAREGGSIHSDVFKEAEEYLVQLAIQLGLLPANGAVGEYYCGIYIPDPSTAR